MTGLVPPPPGQWWRRRSPALLAGDLADTRRSLLNSVDATVAAQRERDAALRLLAAVRALCEGAESEGQHHVTIEAVRAAISPERGTT